ncbi:MAG: dTMP kinase [Alphaproteobacteria bacterium]|nr:dTMP kinase [Alphaproteobacteria bacterium]
MFITFEGGEGTGKSTQVKLLAARLQAEGREVITTREPGGTAEAEALRNLLVSGDVGRWTADEEMLLNFAARGSHLRQLIVPALQAGKTVICDRFVDSTYVYQCLAGGARRQLLSELSITIIAGHMPDITFVLDIDPEIAMARAKSRNDGQSGASRADRFERKGLAFHQRVRAGFLDVARQHPKRCHVIDANGTVEEIASRIWAKLDG